MGLKKLAESDFKHLIRYKINAEKSKIYKIPTKWFPAYIFLNKYSSGCLEKYILNDAYYMRIVLIVTEENKEGGDDANMMQMNGDIQGNGATNQEDAEMEEGKKWSTCCNLHWIMLPYWAYIYN